VAQQGSPPGRSLRQPADDHGPGGRAAGSRRAVRPRRPEQREWQRDAFGPEDTDAELPAWAEPSSYRARTAGARQPAGPDPFTGGYAGEDSPGVADAVAGPIDGAAAQPAEGRPGGRRSGRAAAARLRKSRRRVYRWSVIAVGACVLAAVIVTLMARQGAKPSPYVTSLQAGEFKSVPSACTSVSAAVLTQYLPGAGRTTTNQFSQPAQSQCSFTIDAKPVFRLLEVSEQAYQPFAAASGNGSASENAQDNLVVARGALASPPKRSPLSPARILPLAKLGQQAFAAVQRETAGGIDSDIVTVVVLERNVVITVALSAQESGGFTETAAGTLEAGATAAARDVLAQVLTQPTA
jgi:hypothetical protein